MYMTFCYPQVLKGYFYQCWKRILDGFRQLYIVTYIVGNYTLYTKSDFYEIANFITNFLGQPLSVKCDFWNGFNNERYRIL